MSPNSIRIVSSLKGVCEQKDTHKLKQHVKIKAEIYNTRTAKTASKPTQVGERRGADSLSQLSE